MATGSIQYHETMDATLGSLHPAELELIRPPTRSQAPTPYSSGEPTCAASRLGAVRQ